MLYKPVKKTGFLEAVDACIKHEERVRDFYRRHAESLKKGSVKKLFFMLENDVDGHVHLIEHIRDEVLKNNAHPDIRMTSEIQEFQNTSLSRLMKRLDRNTQKNVGEDEVEALLLAAREHGDTAAFYAKLMPRFKDAGILLLFKTLSNFQDENHLLIESYLSYLPQNDSGSTGFYWDDETIHEEVHSTGKPVSLSSGIKIKEKLKKNRNSIRKSS